MDKTKAIANHRQFKRKADKLVTDMEALIKTVPQKGDTSEECQHILLMLCLDRLDAAINGTTPDDFIPNNS